MTSVPHPDVIHNPYLQLLYDALAERGVRLSPANGFGPWWALRTRTDIVHLHWIEMLFRGSPQAVKGAVGAHARALRLLLTLAILRLRRIGVVWTLHNLQPHEPRFPRLERFMSRSVARLSHTVIVHSRYARGRAAAELGLSQDTFVVMPHGSYIGVYPDSPVGKEEARDRLGLPRDAFVFLAFGQLRQHKCLEELLEVFGSIDDERLRLVVAGQPGDAGIANAMRRGAARDDRVVLRMELVPDEEVAVYHAAADCAVFNYRELFSSGALLLALSFGLPAVVLAGGSAVEVAGTGVVESQPGRLAEVMAAMPGDDIAQRGEAARRAAEHATWEQAAAAAMVAYELAAPAVCAAGRVAPQQPHAG